jgi:hypothetical protein
MITTPVEGKKTQSEPTAAPDAGREKHSLRVAALWRRPLCCPQRSRKEKELRCS